MIEEEVKGEADRDLAVDPEIGMIEEIEEEADRHPRAIEGEADLQEAEIDKDIDLVL
jgi:hypothetical protein